LPEIVALIKKEHAAAKRKYGYIKRRHDAIVHSDAILVLNFDKNNIPHYIGCNTMMEMGFAYVADKKIFLLHPLPDQPYIHDELHTMDITVIDGDLSLIA